MRRTILVICVLAIAAAAYGQNTELLQLYNSDDMAMYVVPSGTVAVDPAIPTEEKLSLLTEAVAEKTLRSLPIEFLELQIIDENLIAIVELLPESVDDKAAMAQRWTSNMFQGSSAGIMAEKVLTITFLQPELDGEWIDGVLFYWGGKPFPEIGFEHVYLAGIRLRSDYRPSN